MDIDKLLKGIRGEGKMRLIDADALKAKLNPNIIPQWFYELIDNAPTVEAKQGEWIYHTDGYIAFYTCNRCNKFGDKDDKFCSNCGAKMKKGGAE